MAFIKLFLEEFKKESDRACVILAGAILDDTLEFIIKKRLVKVDSKKEDLLFDGPNAPISSFSSKIDFAYRLGLISKKLHRDLNLIRKMRNIFAHDIINCNFDNQTIQNLVNELKSSTGIVERNVHIRKVFDQGLRGDFQMILSQIIWYFWSGKFLIKIELINETMPEWIYSNI